MSTERSATAPSRATLSGGEEPQGARRADVCAVAIAEAFRGDGETLCNPIGNLPLIGGRLAAATFEPGLALTDGFYTLIDDVPPVGLAEPERLAQRTVVHWNPYRAMFSLLWHGRRHVMMGATQVDRHGNQNIAAIGDWHRPRSQLLGFRGAPGNTVNHTTSYWVPRHSPKVFVEAVDVVCGIGYDRAALLGPTTARHHEIRRVVSDLAVMDFEAIDERGIAVMRLRSVHPGVTVDEVLAATGFDLVVPEGVAESRLADAGELAELDRLDPQGLRFAEVPQP